MSKSTLKNLLNVFAKEITFSLLLLLGVSTVVFWILYLAPGDPFNQLLAGQLATNEARQEISSALGIPTSAVGQFFSWLGSIAQGNFGVSLRTGKPVIDEIFTYGGNTLYLTFGALFVALFVAVPIAVYASLSRTNILSWTLTLMAYLLSAVPVFWVAYVIIYVSTTHFGVLPVRVGFQSVHQNAWLLVLTPVFVLGLVSGTTSEMVRFLRQELERVLDEEYIRAARARGASLWRHVFKDGLLLPITTVITNKVPFLLGGAIIVEQIFNRPGLGRLAWQAAQDRDFPIIMGITLAAGILVRLAYLVQRIIFLLAVPQKS